LGTPVIDSSTNLITNISRTVVLNPLSKTSPSSNSPLFQAPLTFKKVVKTNVFLSKFINQTFHVVERVKAYALLEIYLLKTTDLGAKSQ